MSTPEENLADRLRRVAWALGNFDLAGELLDARQEVEEIALGLEVNAALSRESHEPCAGCGSLIDHQQERDNRCAVCNTHGDL